ncbi:MAG TPA: hypothetical protein EYG71_03875 [Leucothrix sp.]|nr:hypothetical protein [Leucothrix sp.]
MKHLLPILWLSLSLVIVQPSYAFDLKSTFNEFVAGVKKIPDDIKRKANNTKGKVKTSTIEKRKELKNKTQYINNTDKRLKEEAKLRHKNIINKQEQKLALQKKQLRDLQKQLDTQKQKIKALKNQPKVIKKEVKDEYKKMSNNEKNRLESLLK